MQSGSFSIKEVVADITKLSIVLVLSKLFAYFCGLFFVSVDAVCRRQPQDKTQSSEQNNSSRFHLLYDQTLLSVNLLPSAPSSK